MLVTEFAGPLIHALIHSYTHTHTLTLIHTLIHAMFFSRSKLSKLSRTVVGVYCGAVILHSYTTKRRFPRTPFGMSVYEYLSM